MKHSQTRAIQCLFLVTFVTSGCAVIKSNSHSSTTATGEGLVYSLPRGSVQLVAERKKVAAEDVKKAKDAMEESKAKAEISSKALADAKANLKKLEGELNLAPAGAKQKLTEDVAIAQAVASYAKVIKEAEELNANAAKAKYLNVANSLDQWIETAALSLLPVGPDPAARYVADLSHNATRDDNLKLSVANGLLTSSAATATDQMPNILLSIAQAIGLGKVPGPTGPSMSWMQTPRTSGAAVSTCDEYSLSVTFDPTSEDDIEAKLSSIPANAGIVVVIGPISSDAINAAKTFPKPLTNSCASSAAGSCNGLLYRVPTSVETKIKSKDVLGCELKSAQVAASSVVVVPDSSFSYLMPTKAGAFTTSKLTYAFKDGMPIEYNIERPSEVASIMSLPVQIAKALISIPAEILTLRVNHDTQANALIAAKTAEMNAQVAQLEAKRALEDARKVEDLPDEDTASQ